MYLRAAHVEKSTKALLEFIQKNPLGVLTTAISSTEHDYLQSSHVPWVLDWNPDDMEAPVKGRLRGHMARQNPQAKALIESASIQASTTESGKPVMLQNDVMILFTHPDHHYVTPKFYTETKPKTGKVVPTWNYAAVQIYGKATIYHEASSLETSDYLHTQIQDLSDLCETSIMGYTGTGGRNQPWKVADADDRYVDILRKNIIGIEVVVEKIGGKFKMSQEMGARDRQGVIEGFESLGTETGSSIARMVKARGKLKSPA